MRRDGQSRVAIKAVCRGGLSHKPTRLAGAIAQSLFLFCRRGGPSPAGQIHSPAAAGWLCPPRNPKHYTGNSPMRANSRRIATMASRFMPRALTVARPLLVRPRSRNVFVKRKWLCHLSRRGLNNSTSFPVRESLARIRAAFLSEHDTQASARFSDFVSPPAESGSI